MQAIRFGIIGLGRIGNTHAYHFTNEPSKYNLVAVCGRDLERTETFRKKYDCAGYSSYADFLSHSEMELVIICTRSLDHADDAVQALAAGKYVLLDE